MKTGLFFGSFNPVHNGHLIIASHILNFTDIQQLWLVVTPQNPLKNPTSLLNQYHRLNLVKLAIKDDIRMRASNIEFSLPKPSYTINTLTFLKERYNDYQFCLIIGSDSYKNLDNWKNSDIIRKDYELYVYTRPGFETYGQIPSNVHLLNSNLLDISSTYIRSLIVQKKSIRYLVPDIVANEIEAGNYYLLNQYTQ